MGRPDGYTLPERSDLYHCTSWYLVVSYWLRSDHYGPLVTPADIRIRVGRAIKAFNRTCLYHDAIISVGTVVKTKRGLHVSGSRMPKEAIERENAARVRLSALVYDLDELPSVRVNVSELHTYLKSLHP